MPTQRDKLSPEPITSPLRNKSRTTFGSTINDSKKDEDWTYLNDIKGRGGRKFHAIATQSSIEEEPEPNLNQVIDNIQVEHVVSVIELVLAVIESFQPIQLVVEYVQMENL